MGPFEITRRVREVAEPLAHAEGVRLLDVTFAREGSAHVLRLTIERPDGPTGVDDCEAVSRAVATALDVADVVPNRYLLEVSSAGVTRPLRGLADFRRVVGQLVSVQVRGDRSGPLVGTLAAAEESGLVVALRDGSRRTVALADVAGAHREIEFGRPRT